jgi:hypothetical protein
MKVWPILLFAFLIYFYLAISSPGSIETGDTFQHYNISRFSLKHHELLLNQWGKPLFTLLTVPFSQFGYLGMKVFNIIVALATAYMTFRVAIQLGKPNPHMAIFFVLFSVLYIQVALSGLTETLFTFVLISVIYLHILGRVEWAATLCSFSPFVRFDGYLLICAYATLLILQTRYSKLGYLIIGLAVFNSLGYLQSGDPAWLFTTNPHASFIFNEFYGKAVHKSITHYAWNMPGSIGDATTFLLVVGYIGIILEATGRKAPRRTFLDEGIMIHSFVIIMLGFYTVIAMGNLFTSIGMLRVMINVLPCMALIAQDGYNMVLTALARGKNTPTIIGTIVVLLVIFNAFSQGELPIEYAEEQQMFNKVYEWYKGSNETGAIVYDRSPYLAYLLGIDPYDPQVNNNIAVTYRKRPPPGSLIIWDSHHAKLDAKIPLELFNKSADYKLITRIDIGENVKTMNGDKYEVQIFKRTT